MQFEGAEQVARRSDMDMNGHINNVTYTAWALETVPIDIYLTYSLVEVMPSGLKVLPQLCCNIIYCFYLLLQLITFTLKERDSYMIDTICSCLSCECYYWCAGVNVMAAKSELVLKLCYSHGQKSSTYGVQEMILSRDVSSDAWCAFRWRQTSKQSAWLVKQSNLSLGGLRRTQMAQEL